MKNWANIKYRSCQNCSCKYQLNHKYFGLKAVKQRNIEFYANIYKGIGIKKLGILLHCHFINDRNNNNIGIPGQRIINCQQIKELFISRLIFCVHKLFELANYSVSIHETWIARPIPNEVFIRLSYLILRLFNSWNICTLLLIYLN